jgi:hypothetical protein
LLQALIPFGVLVVLLLLVSECGGGDRRLLGEGVVCMIWLEDNGRINYVTE